MIEQTPDQKTSSAWLSPDQTHEDLRWLRLMWKQLVSLRNGGMPKDVIRQGNNTLLPMKEADGRIHRVVLPRFEELQALPECTFVGFFGLRRPETQHLDVDLLKADEQLLAEFEHNRNLLSYSSVQLDHSGTWGNLVVFSKMDGIEHWRQGSFHQSVAVELLSPKAYLAIRLHNGRVRGGFQEDAEFQLRGTKYYDYARP